VSSATTDGAQGDAPHFSRGPRAAKGMGMNHAPLTRLLAPALLLALAACGQSGGDGKGATAEPVAVGDAFCRPTPNGRLMTACYITLTARADDQLVSVSSPVARRVELHESRAEGGMIMMNPLADGLALPAGRLIELKSGGNHMMLMGLSGPLTDGDSVPLTLTFAHAPAAEVTAWVRAPETE
jgi:copper(I)-binding protein